MPPTVPTLLILLYTSEDMAMATFCSRVNKLITEVEIHTIADQLATTMTIVLCPREKYNPQVTGNCPKLISPLVALSMALYRTR